MKARKKKTGTEPESKKKKPKENMSAMRKGYAAELSRNEKGDLVQYLPPDYGGITKWDLKENARMKAGTGDGSYSGMPAPRVGGVKVKKSDGPVKGGTKAMVRKARKRARNSSASKAAKRAAIRAYM